MFEPNLIEKELKCSNKNHTAPVEMVIWDPQLSKDQRLICKVCQSEQFGAKILMPIKEAMDRAHAKQKSMIEKITPAIQENEKYIKSLESEINKLKDNAFQALESITKNAKTWLEQLQKVKKSTTENYSFIEELDKMITGNASEEQVQIIERIHIINNAFFQKIDIQLNNFFLFKEYSDCQKSLVNVIQINLSDFTQSNNRISSSNEYKALCQQHKEKITFVNLAPNINKDQRAACKQCKRRDGEYFEDFIDQWKQFDSKQKEVIQNSQNNLQKIIEEKLQFLNKMRLDSVNQFSKQINQLWIIMLKGLKKQFETVNSLANLYNEGQINEMAERLISQNEIKSDDLQQQVIDSMQNLISQISNNFSNLQPDQDKKLKPNQGQKQQPDQCLELKKVLKKTIEQDALSIGMAINQDGSKIITCSEQNLILWNMNQTEIKQIATLKGHNDYINCVVFNKDSNCIISGCEDSSIRLWKEQNQNQWESIQADQKHNQRISCLILNSKEDKLFSGSSDSKICVWNIDISQKQIKFQQILQKHNSDVYSLSLNQQNTFLISCSQNQKIVIWEYQNDQWKFKQFVENQIKGTGYRLSFLNENTFIWVSAKAGQGNICVFSLENQTFVEQKEKKLSLANSTNITDCMYFPIVYNQRNNTAYVKHKKHLYIIKTETQSQNWTINAIELDNAENLFGAISANGKIIVTYNQNLKRLQFIELVME
ncbi:unnamed protein product [Paramecium sonneborni]|uniref:WD40-repeat-containing domain n=1 Tax=Paramecium sonneborni TaxID=65129 RepID=A0A8S1NRT5_9CILI|nr:unnamed protein product [Paramecium sonneborni]